MKECKDIWVFAECSDKGVHSVYSELIGKAKEIAVAHGDSRVCAVALGYDLGDKIEAIKKSGADAVYVVDDERLKEYNCDYYAAAFTDLVKEYKPESIVVGATAIGSELAPTVAAKVKTGLAAHCVDMKLDANKNLVCMVPAFGSKVLSDIYIPKHRPQMASVRPGIIAATPVDANPEVEVIEFKSSSLDSVKTGIELVGFDTYEESAKKLEDAEIVVCAGRGINTEEAWQHINELAEKLGASVGYTRSLMDNGWTDDESNMIGASGKSVKPKVYLGFGISGAMHHVCGIAKSRMIISVNKDARAKSFETSDYVVVSDADKILKALIAKLG